ncbi:ATP-binding protein [Rufibacter sediminis]|uniref:histidine kinase n=1 Tax=Rufibacter sediminis TaxID=2762756 RepID=A0ABR6VRA1_9BACT|nr:HAMP domain-containing sensor histidine kinase [Rufibacter sediminis]MBC3539682.1 HAMP domain-containing histidine kinase [Rufibacter sediminis]
MNIQTQATLLFSVLTSLVILLFCGFIYFFTNHYAFEDFYKRLETRVNLASAAHLETSAPGNPDQLRQLRQVYLEKLPEEKDYILEVPAVNPLAGLRKSGLPLPFLADALNNNSARFRTQVAFYAGSVHQSNGRRYLVVVSAKNPYGLEEVTHLSRILLLGFFLSVVLVFFMGKQFTRQTFKPIREIIKKVKGMTAENLNLRLEVGTNKDELTELTQTFNDLLIRLETAFETQNNFVSNASHELRTPLTIIKGEAELALMQSDLPTGPRRSLEKIHHEADKLKDILTSLLGIAQSGFDGKKQNWELVRIDELLWLVKESADQLYPDNNIQIDFGFLPQDESELLVSGNVNLLKLAVSNIVMNACKYSHNQTVKVQILSNKGQLTISVQDKGIGIPEGELPYVFVPFFRASNTSDFEGHGVGLPLSLNIIRLHKGSIGILTQEGSGTEIQINLPQASSL